MKKTEFIAKGTSPQARKFINAARSILYSVQMTPAIKHMLTGADSLLKSAPPFIATLVMKLQAKLGPLNQQDLPVVVMHICGSVADLAKELGDPEAKDTHALVGALMTKVKQMLTPQGQPQQGGPPQTGAPPAAPAAAPMQQLGGQ